MKYNNLQDLISHSSSSRRYFLSLPVSLQLVLHEQGDYICTATDLHLRTDMLEKYNHAVKNTRF